MALNNMGVIPGSPGDEKWTSAANAVTATTPRGLRLGQKMELPDGRVFRFVKNGATEIPAGRVVQAPVPSANLDELVTAAAAVGATRITITTGSTALTKDTVAYVNVEDDAGEGHLYAVASNPAIATTTTDALDLYPTDPVKVAITAASTTTVVISPYTGVIIHPSPSTAPVLGVTQTTLAANYYGWVQTRGLCSVLTDGTLVIGNSVMASDAVDGAVEPWGLTEATPNTEIEPAIGIVHEVAADTEHSLVFLRIE